MKRLFRMGLLTGMLLARPVLALDFQYIDAQIYLYPEGLGAVRADYHASFEGSTALATRHMDALGIGRSIVTTWPHRYQDWLRFDVPEFASALAGRLDRFAYVGGGALLNNIVHKAAAEGQVDADARRLLEENARLLVEKGAVGFGEIAIEQLGLTKKGTEYLAVPADHELMLALADLAARYDVPLVVDMEPIPTDRPLPDTPFLAVGSNPPQLKANLEAFKRLLRHNRQAKILWGKAGVDLAGGRTPGLVRNFLQRNPNLYVGLAAVPLGKPQSRLMDEAGRVQPEWLALIRDFPDRFVIATATLYKAKQPKPPNELPRRLLESLPPELARQVGLDNPRRLFKLEKAVP
jgi:hypothetical protein